MTSIENQIQIKGKHNKNNIFNILPKPFCYSGQDYGFNRSLSGKGIKIALIDSGEPDHKDITNISESIDFSDMSMSHIDKNGHATMLSGIIGGSNTKGILGIAPHSQLYSCKVINNFSECKFEAVVAGLLWAVAKNVHIILMSLGSKTDYPVLYDAIKKCNNNGICLIAASSGENASDYPAAYPEVLSVSNMKQSQKRRKKTNLKTGEIQIVLPANELYTTFINNKYTIASGSSLAAAIVAGLSALIIEKMIMKNVKYTPRSVYEELSKMQLNPKR